MEALPDLRLKLTVEMETDSLYIARVEPYRLSDLDGLLASIKDNPLVEITPIGKTVGGRQLEIVRGMAQSDREQFDELARSLQESASHLAKAKNVSQRAADDRIPDSERILELQEKIGRLFIEQLHCERAMKEPHGDWTKNVPTPE